MTRPERGGGRAIGHCARLASLGSLLLAGCASQPAAVPGGPAGVIEPERSARGNPPFYEVFGRRYYVRDTSDGYRERGVASWYGRDFHGNPTSSGEPYDMHAMTAAHKTLPIPTWVEVRNLSNDRRVVVRVNDRGPFVGDRIIDLSFRAAEALGMVRDGTARVEVRALGAPAAGTLGAPAAGTLGAPAAGTLAENRGRRGLSLISDAEAATPGPGDRPLRELYIQVGAFSERRNALALAERLRGAGFSDVFLTSDGPDGALLHKVRIGPVAGAEQYDRVSGRLQSIGVDARMVVGGR